MNEQNRLSQALIGGLIFIVGSAILQALFSDDPSYVAAILGGVAFAISWAVVARLIDRQR